MSDENKFTIEEKSDMSENAEGKSSETKEQHKDKKQPPRICYMCRRSENKAGRLIEIPGGICVCSDCLQKSFDSMQNGAVDYSEIMRNLPPAMGMFDFSNLNLFTN